MAKCTTYVLFSRRKKNKALGLRDTKQERLYFKLRAMANDGVEIDSKDASEFAIIHVSVNRNLENRRTWRSRTYAVFVVVSASSRRSSVIAVRSRKYRRTRAAWTGLSLLYHAVNAAGV